MLYGLHRGLLRRKARIQLQTFSTVGDGAKEVPRLQWNGVQNGLQEEQLLSGGPAVLCGARQHLRFPFNSFEDLEERLGERQVPVEMSQGGADYRDAFMESPRPGKTFQADVIIPLSLLLQHMREQADPSTRRPITLYLAQKDIADVLPELAVRPADLPLRVAGERLFQQSIWLGPCGTKTPLHCDPYFNLLSQVWGRKRVRIYSPEDSRKLYPFSTSVLRNTSQVDTEKIDDAKFPEYADTPSTVAVLQPGDMLFLPKKYWHEVISLEASMSMSYWWT